MSSRVSNNYGQTHFGEFIDLNCAIYKMSHSLVVVQCGVTAQYALHNWLTSHRAVQATKLIENVKIWGTNGIGVRHSKFLWTRPPVPPWFTPMIVCHASRPRCTVWQRQPFNGHIKTAQKRIIIEQYGGWYTGRWWVGWYILYSEEGSWRAAAPPSPLLAVANVSAHPSTASVPTSYYSM